MSTLTSPSLEKFNRVYRIRFALVNAKGLELGYVYLLDGSGSDAYNIHFSTQISANEEGEILSSICIYNPPKAVIELFKTGEFVRVSLSVGYGGIKDVQTILDGTVAKSRVEVRKSKKRLHLFISNENPNIGEGKNFPLGTPVLSVVQDLLSKCSAGEIKGSRGMEALSLSRDLNFSGDLRSRLNFLAAVFEFQWFQMGRAFTVESLNSLKTKMATRMIGEGELMTHPQASNEDYVLYLPMKGDVFPGDVFQLILNNPLGDKAPSKGGVYSYTMQVKNVLHEGKYARGGWMTRLTCFEKV